MPSVGDVIVNARTQFPDPCQVVAAPSLSAGALTASTTGGSLATGTYFFKGTQQTAWGETSASGEISLAVTGPTGSVAVSWTALPGATAGRMYFGTAASVENEYVALTLSGSNLSGTITSLGAGIGSTLPQFNSAFLPDTDGSVVSAFLLYRWLNEGLREASRLVGGILDMTGVQAKTNKSQYEMNTGGVSWVRFSDAWFDGYYLGPWKRQNVYMRNYLQSISRTWTVEQIAERFIIRLYLSPNRTGVTTTLNGAPSATTDTIPVVSIPAGMIVPTMLLIDNEIIQCATTDGVGNFLGAVRGWGGTIAASHGSGATVTELNIKLAGYRQPATYSVGNSNSTLAIPPSWETPLSDYLTHRYRKHEGATDEAQKLYQEFLSRMHQIAIDDRGMRVAGLGGPDYELKLYRSGPWGVIVN